MVCRPFQKTRIVRIYVLLRKKLHDFFCVVLAKLYLLTSFKDTRVEKAQINLAFYSLNCP